MASTIMNSLGDKPNLRTDRGLERAEKILMSARDILIFEGYAGLTMRKVAIRAGMSLSNVQHYYKGLEGLMEALLIYLMDGYQQQIEVLIQSMHEHTQHERLIAVLDLLFAEGRKPEVSGVFVEAWALAQRLPFAARVMQQIQDRERKAFYRLMFGLNSEVNATEYKKRAALSVTLIDGLMVQTCNANTSSLNREELEQLIRQQILNLAR